MTTTVLWHRRDLRRGDLPALSTALDGGAVLPLVVLDPALWAGAGRVRQSRYAASVRALQTSYDGALVVRWGDPAVVVPEVAAEVGAQAVHVTAEPSPYGRRRDARVRTALAAAGRDLRASGTPYAVGPGVLRTGAGTPYQVFTPFRRAWREHGWPRPATLPRAARWRTGVPSEPLPGAGPGETASGDRPAVGEGAALARWAEFLDHGVADYAEHRDRPDVDGTSRLSEALKYGELHPRTLLADLADRGLVGGRGGTTFASELAWREFYADVLWHHPRSAWTDLRPLAMSYDEPGTHLAAWEEGRTGYPFVDAGMRQLAATGWMHNRVRMVTASFLVKDLHLWWPHGARHFLALLRDGDLASNAHGWQWVAGTGTDAAPYFRIFNPVSQGCRFDPDGAYVRRWVPELAHLHDAAAHEPWRHPQGYDHGYPQRIVDHDVERREALARYQAR
ncbi:MAG TPA: deoxyribodipyrimidine photo-lyase [Dermatophilaceae bacterium]|nr:deoxyribodipyrimidine photo-lyase [Dermatophilaceae bacterium]